jgi:hypothetical protein
MRSALLGVRLLTLTYGPATDSYRHGGYAGKSIFGNVTRADLGAFMLDNLDEPRYVNESVFVQS